MSQNTNDLILGVIAAQSALARFLADAGAINGEDLAKFLETGPLTAVGKKSAASALALTAMVRALRAAKPTYGFH